MRRMRLTLMAAALVLFGLATSITSRADVLMNLTNQVWQWDQSGADPGAFWEPTFDDSGWLTGRGIFCFETTTTDADLNANVFPFTNTVVTVSNTIVFYFRTHFTFSGVPNNYVLVCSNLIDDGFVMYLNGVEVDRYNMNANDAQAAAANPPPGEGSYVVRPLNVPPDTLIDGDNVLAVRAYQNALTSSDFVWGTWLHASLGYRPRILSPTAPETRNVEQFRSSTLNVTVDAAPAATLQWFFDPVGPDPAAPIAGANATSYTITDMDGSKEGDYYLQASNIIGTSNSPPVTIVYVPDTTAPAFIAASGDLTDLTKITLYFSELVTGPIGTPGPLDPIYYVITPREPGDSLGVASVVYGPSSNIVVLTVAAPGRDPALTYDVIISLHTITDLAGNGLVDPTSPVKLQLPIVVREGVGGYTGTQDTELDAANPDLSHAQDPLLTADLDPTTSQDLLRFDNVIGSQIPLGAVILSAQLSIMTENVTDAGTPIRFLRMQVPWEETNTWNVMVNGIDTNSEATTVDAILDGSQDEGVDILDVTAAVQAWANGQPNYGWAIIPSGGNGWDFYTSEHGTVGNRPQLTIDFFVPPNPCSIADDPDSQTVNEKSPFTLTVASGGSDLRYQWYYDPPGPTGASPIAGATGPSYTVNRAIPANTGEYYVVVENDIPSTCTSLRATITVIADTARPVLTASLGNPDQTTITLTFNDTMDPASAGTPGNYSLGAGAPTVTGATVNGNTVTLTTGTPRVAGTDYTLTITGIRDDAVQLNLIDPNPTSTNLAQQVRLLPFGATWKFETNGLDLGTTWKDPGYNDSAWPANNTVMGLETTAGTFTALFNQGLNTNNMTLWSLLRPDGTTNITWYLRTSVNIPFDLANATVNLRHVIDDGAVVYFNGDERFRFTMPAGPVDYLTEATGAPGEGVIRTTTLTNISCGNNVIAVSLHNDNAASSDILFDAEVLATFQSFQICVVGPELSIVNNGDGTVTLSWTPAGGTLQESTDLVNWGPSAHTNGQTFAPTGLKFFRVQVP